MSNDNKEKSFPEGTAAEDTNSDGEWQWDAAVPETKTDDITVDELQTETVESPSEEPEAEEPVKNDDDGLCIVCGKPRGKSPSDLYCETCRRKFLRTNYGVGHIILAFLMVFVAAIGYFVCVSTCQISTHLTKAQSYLDERRFDDAVNECSAISEEVETLNSGVNSVFTAFNKNHTADEIFVDGNRSFRIVLKAYSETVTVDQSQMSTYIQYVDNIIGEKELKKSENAQIKKVYDFCEEFLDYAMTTSEKWQTFVVTDEKTTEISIKYDEAMAYIDTLKTDTAAKRSWNEYLRFMSAYYAKEDNATVVGYFDKAYAEAGEFAYMYDPNYMMLLFDKKEYNKLIEVADSAIERNVNNTSAYYYVIKANIILGDYTEADSRCEDMRKASPDNLDYYSTKAEILRRQGKFTEAVDICKEGIAKGNDSEIYRQQSIAYMLNDDKDSALEAANQAYDIALQYAYTNSEISLEVLNTSALIACICGDNELYEEIISIFEQQGVTLEQTVQNCIKGEITFEELFMEGVGDI